MMKRLLLLLLAVLICVPATMARRKTPKSGAIKDGVFVDATYGFKLNIAPEWSASLKKLDSPARLTLIQKNYEIPPDYLDAEDYTKVPRVTVFVAESPWSATAFRDSLLSDTYDSDQKNEILKDFEILNEQAVSEGGERQALVTKGRESLYINEKRAAQWFGEAQYTNNVTQSVSSQTAKAVRGAYAGAVVVVKNGDQLLLFHLITEKMYFMAVWSQVLPMIESLDWPAAE